MIKMCANGECAKPFTFVGGRHVYCSAQCSKRVHYVANRDLNKIKMLTKRCANPKCAKPFVRTDVGNQKYCEPLCGRRVRVDRDREKINARLRQQRYRDRDKYNERMRRWRAENPARVREWEERALLKRRARGLAVRMLLNQAKDMGLYHG